MLIRFKLNYGLRKCIYSSCNTGFPQFSVIFLKTIKDILRVFFCLNSCKISIFFLFVVLFLSLGPYITNCTVSVLRATNDSLTYDLSHLIVDEITTHLQLILDGDVTRNELIDAGVQNVTFSALHDAEQYNLKIMAALIDNGTHANKDPCLAESTYTSMCII